MKKKLNQKTFLEYKLELENVIIKINENQESFEKMTKLYAQGSEIIQILNQKLKSQEELITDIIKEQ